MNEKNEVNGSIHRWTGWKAVWCQTHIYIILTLTHTKRKTRHAHEESETYWKEKAERPHRRVNSKAFRRKDVKKKKTTLWNWINCNGNCVCSIRIEPEKRERERKNREAIEFLGLPPVTRHVNTMSSPSSIGPSIVPFNWWPHRFNTNGYSGGTERYERATARITNRSGNSRNSSNGNDT